MSMVSTWLAQLDLEWGKWIIPIVIIAGPVFKAITKAIKKRTDRSRDTEKTLPEWHEPSPQVRADSLPEPPAIASSAAPRPPSPPPHTQGLPWVVVEQESPPTLARRVPQPDVPRQPTVSEARPSTLVPRQKKARKTARTGRRTTSVTLSKKVERQPLDLLKPADQVTPEATASDETLELIRRPTRTALRRAIVMSEILRPPLALRQSDDRI